MEISEIIKKVLESRKDTGGINKVFFAACGGSLAAFYPAKYFLEKESKKLVRIGFYTANEFVKATPAALDANSLVIGCSHEGKTPETIEAVKVARNAGAATVVYTYFPDSPIAECGDYMIQYSWGAQVNYALKKECLGLKLMMELLHQTEDWQNYDKAMEGFNQYGKVALAAREKSISNARTFAEANGNEKVIYTVGSGAGWGSAYMECICIFMEMQWIHSNCIHAGEFFHGPLEIVDTNTPFLLMMGDGSTRDLDERAKAFLEKWGLKIFIIDVKDLGINVIDNAVVEYFSPLLLNAVVDVYNNELARVRQHPLSTRRYMWKVSY